MLYEIIGKCVAIIEKCIYEPKNWICSLILMPSPLPHQHNFPSDSYHHPSAFFKILFTPTEKRRKEKASMRDLKKWLKWTLWRYRSQVLINPTVFVLFTFLVYVWLCHNWDSGMLKSEVFNKNKNLIKIPLKNIVCENNSHLNPLMHNVPKCCKIFKVCLTILGHYVFKGEKVLSISY